MENPENEIDAILGKADEPVEEKSAEPTPEPEKKKRGRKPKAESKPTVDAKSTLETLFKQFEAQGIESLDYDTQRAVLAIKGAINLLSKSQA